MTQTYIAYEGPSLLDGKPIVLLVQMGSRNTKTDNMVQTFILRSDIDPISASRTGEDYSICGDCVMRGIPHDGNSGWAKKRGCYVNLLHGPNGKYQTYKKGGYTKIDDLVFMAGLLKNQDVRVGSYGDPSAIPNHVWETILSEVNMWTGYTHSKNNPYPEKYMSSVETKSQMLSEMAKGNRTFRVIMAIDEVVKGKEILCPASKEAGYRTTCKACKLCNGNQSKAKSIAIVAHGNGKKHAANEIQEDVLA